jgi:hypothetical protein
MSQENPYQSPESSVDSLVQLDEETASRLEKMAKGQKLVIYAVLIYFITAALRVVLGPLILVVLLVSLVLSLMGLYKVLSARESHIAVKIILFALLFVPLINILVLLSINSRATKTLREGGYKVGFMGATKPA